MWHSCVILQFWTEWIWTVEKKTAWTAFFFISVVKLIMNCFFDHTKKVSFQKKRQQRVDNELCFDHIKQEFKLSFQKKVRAQKCWFASQSCNQSSHPSNENTNSFSGSASEGSGSDFSLSSLRLNRLRYLVTIDLLNLKAPILAAEVHLHWYESIDPR